MNDVAELTALRAQIESLERQQELLLYIVTHDLRSPVMAILGFAEMLLADSQGDAPQTQSHKYLEHIRNSARRQTQVIQDLQQIAQLQQQPLQRQTVDLTALVRTIFDSLVSGDSGIAIQIATTRAVQCDAELLRTALHSLITITLKLAESVAAPALEFGADIREEELTLWNRTNTTGFDLGADHSLLALFRHLQVRAELGDTGLGLLSAAVIIHRHGGRMWLSTASDQRICIYFTLPR